MEVEADNDGLLTGRGGKLSQKKKSLEEVYRQEEWQRSRQTEKVKRGNA